MANLEESPDATFYLGGQPYGVDIEELRKVGPELAEMAFFETYRHVYRVFIDFHCHRLMSRDEFERQRLELVMGMWALRDLIPDQRCLIPNASFTIVH